MNIEKCIFERSIILVDKLFEYGFKEYEDKLLYKRIIMNNQFEIILEYKEGIIGRIIDLSFNEEYLNYRVNNCGSFAEQIKGEFIELLNDIKEKCCINNYYISNQANLINDYIKNKYNIKPVFLWDRTPDFGVYRNEKNKWFGIIMNIVYNKINKTSKEDKLVEIINVKINPSCLDELLNINGIYEAYHMNKKNWVTIILDNTLDDNLVFNLIDTSYNLVN